MSLLGHFIFSFIASVAFGIILNVPRRALLPVGFIGSMGWVVYIIADQNQLGTIISNFLGALVIGILCIGASRHYRIPVIVLTTPAIVPLVPGAPAYMAVRRAVEENYPEAIDYIAAVLGTAGAIALAFMISKILERSPSVKRANLGRRERQAR